MFGHKVIGKNVPRIDAADKACGKAVFSDDLSFKNMLVGKVLRSPYAHAKILSIDVSKAKALPGVKAVLTSADVPNNFNYLHSGDTWVLAVDKVRYVGDEVALVAAESEEAANQALKLINVIYEPLPVVVGLEEAIKPESILIHENKTNNIAMSLDVTRGDIEKAFSEADVIVSNKFKFPTLHQVHLEPNCAVAWFINGRLTVCCASQVWFRTRKELAKVTGIKESNITVKAMEVGGAFGARNEQINPILAALLSLHTQAPVKLVNSREEEFLATRPSVEMEIEMTIASDKDGRFLGKKTNVLADIGAFTSHGDAVTWIASLRSDTTYRFDSVEVHSNGLYTNRPPTSAYRGFGNPQMHFALESLIDQLALKLNIDPTELRLKNFIRPGETGIHGYRIISCGLVECMEKARQLADWNEKKRSKVFGKGIGVAALVHANGSRAGEPEFSGGSAMVKVEMSGRITVYVGESEIGQGAKTVMAQIAAEEFECDPQAIEVIFGDTDLTPFSTGTHGSKLTTVLGNAVLMASRDVKGQILNFASSYLGKGCLTLKDGWLADNKHDKVINFSELVRRACEKRSGRPFIGLAAYEPDAVVPDETGYGNIAPTYPFGVQIAEVSVQPNGKIKVEKVVSVHDVGKAINPQMIEGQVYGGVTQAVGMATMEHLVTNAEGVVETSTLLEYKIPTIYEIPEIEVGIVETVDPDGPYGAKGIGEPPIIAVAPAVANAIYDAIGIRVTEIPINPVRLVDLMEKNIKNKTE